MLINQEFLISVFAVLVFRTGSEIHELAIDLGRNLTIPCSLPRTKYVMWVYEGTKDQRRSRVSVQENGSLFITEVDRNDSGIYTCSQENSNGDDIKATVKVRVRTPPPLLAVTVHPSTILALLLWTVKDNGGYPINYFTAQYRLADSDEEWKPISPNRISPNSRQIEVDKLEPNTTYAFQMWGTNLLGKGDIIEVEGHTLCDYQELEC